MEHDHHIIKREMDIYTGAACVNRGREIQDQLDGSPLSMPSAPSRIAASNDARVFSGYCADAYGVECVSKERKERKERKKRERTPR